MNETREYGSVDYRGSTITLAQKPYRRDSTESLSYRALGHDSAGNAYLVEWIALTKTNTIADGDDVFDWENYTVTKL